jgi:O-antigen/teichoic acid export membrane protein
MSSRLRRAVATLIGGNAAAFILPLVASPLLTRLYEPAAFGVFALFVAITATVGSVAGARLEQAIPVPRARSVAVRLALLAASAVVVTSLLTALVVHFLHAAGTMPQLDVPGGVGVWAGAGVAGIALYAVASGWAVRERSYGAIATSRMLRAGGQASLQVLLGGWGLSGPGGLIVGYVIGATLGMLRLARSLVPHATKRILRPVRLRWVARRYGHYAWRGVPSGLLNALGTHLPAVLLLVAYGPEVAGLFALTQRVVSVPLAVVGVGFSHAYTGEAAQLLKERQPELLSLYRRTAARIAAVAALVAVPVAVWAPETFAVVFGADWRAAGWFVTLLVPMLVAQIAVVPLSSTLNLMERTDVQLRYDAFRLVVGAGSLAAVAAAGAGAAAAVAAYGAGMTVAYVANFAVSERLLRATTRMWSAHEAV